MYQPLHVGRAVSGDLGYPGDDTGENISALNCYYSELTGLYWIWKNCHDVDYVGTCHYRRYLINEREQILTAPEYERLLSEYDLITTKRVALNNSYEYGFSANHNGAVLAAAGRVIGEKFPEYHAAFERLVARRVELENGEDAYHKRVFGFISEFLLLVWVSVQELKVCECKVGMLGEKAETRELKERLAEYFLRRDVDGAKAFFLKRRQDLL